MKKSNTLVKIITLCFFAMITVASSYGQLGWVKASNVSCYYHTSTDAVFTWTGGCQNSYCNGYGTIQWYTNGVPSGKYVGNVQSGKNQGYGVQYYPNGNIYYDGYWDNDMKSGYGTSYNADGTVQYKGNFVYDQIKGATILNSISRRLAEYVVADIFDGGTNVRYSLEKCVYDRNDNLEEMRVKITFNGDIITTNYYDCTLVIKNTAPFVDFVNMNQRAENYLDLVFTLAGATALYNFFESL